MPSIDIKDMVRGDSYGLTLNFTNKDKTPINVEGRKLTFTVKQHWSQSDAEAQVQVISDMAAPNPAAQGGQAYILINPEDTGLDPGKYVYDVQMVNGAIVTTLMRGNITVVGDVTLGV